MKELSIEQKAQRYDEAIAHAKKLLKTIGNATLGNLVLKNEFERMFPELAESEDDRIRKEMLQIAKESEDSFYMAMTPNKREKLIAWLEKQGKKELVTCPICGWEIEKQGEQNVLQTPTREMILAVWELGNIWKELTNGVCSTEYGTTLDYIQKHWHESEYYLKKQGEENLADNVKSKFKVGDWIVYKDTVWKICNVGLRVYYELLSINNEVIIRHIEGVDKTAHIWTIQDAKDGDVLASKDGDDILIFRKLDGNKSFSSYYNIRRKKEIGWHNGWCYGSFIPATKEQCDALMKVMTDAGYIFDFEKKELKRIEQNLTVTDEELAQAKCFAYNDALGKIEWRNGEPTFDDGWSAAIDYIRKKSLKYEYTWKPSEGQLECLGYAIEKAEKDYSPLINNRIYLTLKALKEELEKL